MPDHPLYESISVPQLSRFYTCPSRRDSFKTVATTRNLEIHFGIRVDKFYGSISVRKFATFGNVVGVSFSWKFKLKFRDFKLVGQRKVNPFYVRPVTINP